MWLVVLVYHLSHREILEPLQSSQNSVHYKHEWARAMGV